MKPVHTLLVIILVISGFLPVPFMITSLFIQDSAVVMLNLGELTAPVKNILTIAGVYMLTAVIIFWCTAACVIADQHTGIKISLVLGMITLLRGILLFCLFDLQQSRTPFLAYGATIDGSLIVLLSLIARRIKKAS